MKKLGIMISAAPEANNFSHGLNLAETALKHGHPVYLYCIDEAVRGLADARIQQVKEHGAKLFACAYSMQEREIESDGGATPSGLTILSDLISGTDRFISFN
jgi:predicted peroxiredoxin